MKRRDAIVGLGAAVAWPFMARAQAQPVPVVGVLHSGAADAFTKQMAVLQASLKDNGYSDGQNISIMYRWADSHAELLPKLASDLVQQRVAVIATFGGNGPVIAAKAATKTIPIIFVTGADPVKAGLVASLNRPDGNATGVAFLVEQVGSKMLGLLHELVPGTAAFGVLVNANNPNTARQIAELEQAARTAGVKLHTVALARQADLDSAFASLVDQHVSGLVLGADPLFADLASRIIELSAKHRIPTVYYRREFADAGGLMSYGTSATESYARAGAYVARILKGEKPSDLPVFQVVKFEFVINLKTAKALGVSVPLTLLGRADEMIE